MAILLSSNLIQVVIMKLKILYLFSFFFFEHFRIVTVLISFPLFDVLSHTFIQPEFLYDLHLLLHIDLPLPLCTSVFIRGG